MKLTKLADGRYLVECDGRNLVLSAFALAVLVDQAEAALGADRLAAVALPTVDELAERYRKEWRLVGTPGAVATSTFSAERALRLIRGDAA